MRRMQPGVPAYLLVLELDPPGPLLDAAEPPLPGLLDDAAPPGEDDAAPPAPELLVPPIPLGLELELEEAPPGELGAVVVDDEEDEPPGTTTVSFSLTVSFVGAGLLVVEPPGITVVVSFFSQPASANAPNRINK